MAVVDTVTNLVVAYNRGISSQAEEMLASQEVLSSIELVIEVLNGGHVSQYFCCAKAEILQCM
jgi:hypothetical protein